MLKARYRGDGAVVRVISPPNSYGHSETGPRFKVSSERAERPGIELTIPEFIRRVALPLPNRVEASRKDTSLI